MTPDPDHQSFHMTPDEFRRHGKELVDWVADYLERVEDFPVLSRAAPGSATCSEPTPGWAAPSAR